MGISHPFPAQVGSDPDARRAARLRWPSLERLRLLSEFASAVDFLHSGAAIPATVVLHRDLKPDNLGLTDAGQLKLLDFGLAVALRKDTNRATGRYELTGGTGSRRYMAPEVYFLQYAHRADVYSFGVLLWELVYVERPWGRLSDFDVLVALTMRHRRPPLTPDSPALTLFTVTEPLDVERP